MGKIFTKKFNELSSLHLIQNIGERTTIELHPAERGECVWFIVASYPNMSLVTQMFTVNRYGSYSTIFGADPVIRRFNADNYVSGYVSVKFCAQYMHVFVSCTMPCSIIGC